MLCWFLNCLTLVIIHCSAVCTHATIETFHDRKMDPLFLVGLLFALCACSGTIGRTHILDSACFHCYHSVLYGTSFLSHCGSELDRLGKDGNRREEYLSWEEYFMAVAFLSSKCSEDPHTQVGACIVDPDKTIVGIGYNSMPRGCTDLPWCRRSETDDPFQYKYHYVCYAARHAVLNCSRANLKNCILYTSLFPSYECAKILVQAQITEVVYFSDKYADREETKASKHMFRRAHVKFRKYNSRALRTKIAIEFVNKVDVESVSQPVSVTNVTDPQRIEWGPTFFMALAFLTAQRSKDPQKQVGACIVNEDNQVVSVAYNSKPRGWDDDDVHWAADDDKRDKRYSYVCHAELNAVTHRNCATLKNCTIYVTQYPCNECAKILIESRLREVIYYSRNCHHDGKIDYRASSRMLGSDTSDLPTTPQQQTATSHTSVRKYSRVNEERIVLDFHVIDAGENETLYPTTLESVSPPISQQEFSS